MVQCLITGKFDDSGSFPINGKVVVTLDAPLTATDKTVHLPIPQEYPFNNGEFSFTLESSEAQQITYFFEVYNQLEDLSYPVDSIYSFHSVVPVVTEINFRDLIPSQISTDQLPSNIRRLLQLIVLDPNYSNLLRWGSPAGFYSPSTPYVYGDIVTYDGSSYLCINENGALGYTPSIVANEYWQPLGIRGEPGTGTGGNDTPFSFAAWTSQTDAPTRNTLANALIDRNNPRVVDLSDDIDFDTLPDDKLVPAKYLRDNLINRNNPRVIDLSDDIDLDTLPDDKLVPAKYLKDKFAPLDSPILTGNPLAPTKGINDGTDSIATCAYVKNNIDYLTTPRLVGEMVQIMLTRSQLPQGQLIYEDPSSGWLYHYLIPAEPGVINEIGNSQSNASTLSRDDLFPYFEYWWHILGQTSGSLTSEYVKTIRLSDNTVSTRGVSAQADWNSNKKLRFIDNDSGTPSPYYGASNLAGLRGRLGFAGGAVTLYTFTTVLLIFTGVRN